MSGRRHAHTRTMCCCSLQDLPGDQLDQVKAVICMCTLFLTRVLAPKASGCQLCSCSIAILPSCVRFDLLCLLSLCLSFFLLIVLPLLRVGISCVVGRDRSVYIVCPCMVHYIGGIAHVCISCIVKALSVRTGTRRPVVSVSATIFTLFIHYLHVTHHIDIYVYIYIYIYILLHISQYLNPVWSFLYSVFTLSLPVLSLSLLCFHSVSTCFDSVSTLF